MLSISGLSLFQWGEGTLVRLVGAALIFFGFLFFRGIFTNLILKLLLNITRRTKTRLDDYIAGSFEKPLQLFFVFLGLYLALVFLPLSRETNAFISNVFRSALIILVGAGLYNFSDKLKKMDGELTELFHVQVDQILLPFFSKACKFIIVALVLTMVAQEWDYRIDGFIAGLGLGGLAFSLAAKDTLSNVFGGLVVILDKPFSIGDWIKTPSVEGTVEDISFRSTKVRTFAQALVTVPNATLANEPVTNWTRMGKRRVTYKLGLTYDTTGEKLKRCIDEIYQMLRNHPGIHQDTVFVRFDSFGESGLELLMYFFTSTTSWAEFLQVKEDTNFKIMEILEKEGVSIALPSRAIYVEKPPQAIPVEHEKR
ncbi:MAG TPA: mechanosensitive ion channel family protein [Clostridia bacterium]|nr:mechanosensitive ion channel family protein [Clostridia bacterium]